MNIFAAVCRGAFVSALQCEDRTLCVCRVLGLGWCVRAGSGPFPAVLIDLLLGNFHVILHTTKNRGLDKETPLPQTLPTTEKLCPLLLANLAVAQESFRLLLIHLGPLLGVYLKGVPNFPMLSFLHGSLRKLIIDGFFNKDSGTRAAALAHVEEEGFMALLHSVVHVGISQHDAGALPT